MLFKPNRGSKAFYIYRYNENIDLSANQNLNECPRGYTNNLGICEKQFASEMCEAPVEENNKTNASENIVPEENHEENK